MTDQEARYHAGYLANLGAILGALAIYVILATCLVMFFRAPAPLDRSWIEALSVRPAADFQAEPLERLLYVLALVTIPFGALAGHVLSVRHQAIRIGNRQSIYRRALVVSLVLQILILVGIFLVNEGVNAPSGVIGWSTAVMAIGILFARVPAWKPLKYPTGFMLAVIALARARSEVLSLADLNPTVGFSHHFETVFFPAVQVHLGRHLLVDGISMYGLYPYFLEPIFRWAGLSIVSFTLTMASLELITIAALTWVIYRLVQSRLLAGLAWGAVMGCWALTGIDDSPYYQYLPLRTIGPVVLLALSIGVVNECSPALLRIRRFVAWLWCASMAWWVTDIGIIMLFSWCSLRLFQILREHGSRGTSMVVKQVMMALGAYVALPAILMLTHATCGLPTPDFARQFDAIRLFVGLGFNMLPMTISDLWPPVAILYVGAIAVALRALATRESHAPKADMLWLLGVLGAGLFSYYQGRSLIQTLLLCSYPAMIILAMYIDWLRSVPPPETKWTKLGQTIVIALLTGIMGLFCGQTIATLPSNISRPDRRTRESSRQIQRVYGQIARNARVNGPHLLITSFPGTYALAQNFADPTPAILYSPAPILATDVWAYADYMRDHPWVPVVVLFDYLQVQNQNLAAPLVHYVEAHRRLVFSTPDGLAKIYAPLAPIRLR